MAQVLEVDAQGRLRLPDELREVAHIEAPGRISIQVRPDGLLLSPRPAELPDELAQFASLDGPVDSWEALEGDIAAEHGGRPAK